MIIVDSTSQLKAAIAKLRAQGRSVALVPTMGNLHSGHASLIDKARSLADQTIVSVFVNPLQFGPNEDFAQYPRTPEDDEALLVSHGADVLFRPGVDDIYPHGQAASVLIHVPVLSKILCGEFRPGHFDGVATVVAKLLGLVSPDVAVFGEKDFQQLAIIRRTVADLSIPVQIHGAPTIRGPDGLALSSRNRYLSETERAAAPTIFRSLNAAKEKIAGGHRDYAALEAAGTGALSAAGFKVDYFAVRDAGTLMAPTDATRHFVVLSAARIGKARLIDNIQVRVA